jgi:hypothetical protein
MFMKRIQDDIAQKYYEDGAVFIIKKVSQNRCL